MWTFVEEWAGLGRLHACCFPRTHEIKQYPTTPHFVILSAAKTLELPSQGIEVNVSTEEQDRKLPSWMDRKASARPRAKYPVFKFKAPLEDQISVEETPHEPRELVDLTISRDDGVIAPPTKPPQLFEESEDEELFQPSPEAASITATHEVSRKKRKSRPSVEPSDFEASDALPSAVFPSNRDDTEDTPAGDPEGWISSKKTKVSEEEAGTDAPAAAAVYEISSDEEDRPKSQEF